jgi:hypothetical protein
MDNETFDRFVRLMGREGTRRAAVAALLGGGALGAVDTVLGKNTKKRNANKNSNKNKNRRKNKAKNQQAPAGGEVGPEAVPSCFSPGPSSNMKGCDFSDQNLCGFNLSSSNLNNANFEGTNLVRANLRSSSCRGTKFNGATVFCQTRMCDGNINNSDCVAGVTPCCGGGDCPAQTCKTGQCQNSQCVYQNQTDGAAGVQCDAPRECCGGNCCAENQKCCNGNCIPDTDCCGSCPNGQSCCGGTCSVCCNNGTPGCGPDLVCCGGTRTCEPCCGPQSACQFDHQCGISNGESCGTSSSELDIGPHCGDNGVCCLGKDTVCEHDDECCGEMTCGGAFVADVCG